MSAIMSDWVRSEDDPNVYIYKDRYTLRCEYLTWHLYDAKGVSAPFTLVRTQEPLTDVAEAHLLEQLEKPQTNPRPIVMPAGCDVQISSASIAHTHVPDRYRTSWQASVPYAWAEVVVNEYEQRASEVESFTLEQAPFEPVGAEITTGDGDEDG